MIKRIADRLFRWYCHPEFYPDIKGDLEELYRDHVEEGSRFAQLRYLLDVMLLFRISLLRPILKNSIIKDTGMFRNYFKISIRHLARHKMFTTINVVGLAIGLASFLLINEYVAFERSYDSFHSDADQLYRVSYVEVIDSVDGVKDAMSSYLVGEVLNEEIPEVIQHTVTKKLDPITFQYNDKIIKDDYVVSADSNFLKLFDYQVISGSKETMLNQPLSVVLTERLSKKFFGDEDPMGKTINAITPYKAPLIVTGIIEDTPENTHYKFNMLVSDKTLQEEEDYKAWNWNNYYVYLKLIEGANLDAIHSKTDEIAKRFDDETRWDIHPVKWIHLESDFTYEPQQHGNKQAVDFLFLISILVLIIAWVNYINLSTARALDRAKEVGMRKVIGAFRRQLVYQFLLEAFLVNLLGAFLAMIFAQLLLPLFTQLIGTEVIDTIWNHPPFMIKLLVFWVAGSLISGFYPALVLSGFKPLSVLKGKFRNSKSGIILRKTLVVVQFGASLVLIAATLIIYQQLNYMKARDIGITIDKVVSAEVPSSNASSREEFIAYLERLELFKEELKEHSAIETVGATSNLPGGNNGDISATTDQVKLIGFSDEISGTTYIQLNDNNFLDAVDMELLGGRNFDTHLASDSNAIMVNVAFLDRFNLEDNLLAVDEILALWGERYKIVGIIKDFNRTSLKEKVEPTIYLPRRSVRKLVVELDEQNYLAGIEHLEETWKEFYPDLPIDIIFLDDRFSILYDQDKKFGDVFMVFSILAILIASLGLYGLASFLSIQRSKEVGVRKVLGANQGQILLLFYKGFLQLIGVSALIGFPMVYFAMNGWLGDYAYRIDFPWISIFLALAVIVVLALFTVGYQTMKVAKLDPAKTLKYE